MNKNTELFYEGVITRRLPCRLSDNLKNVAPLTENIIGALDDLQNFAEAINKEEDFERTLDAGRTVSTTMGYNERIGLFSAPNIVPSTSEGIWRHFRGREVLKMLYDPTIITDKDILSVFDDICPNLAKGFGVEREHIYKDSQITEHGRVPNYNEVATMQYVVSPMQKYFSYGTFCYTEDGSVNIIDEVTQEVVSTVSIEECARFIRWLTLAISKISPAQGSSNGIIIDLNKIPNSDSKRFEDIEFRLVFIFSFSFFKNFFIWVSRYMKDPYIKSLVTGVITRHSKDRFTEKEDTNE